MLNLQQFNWQVIEQTTYELSEVGPLFERIDHKQIDEEVKKLKAQSTLA